MRHGVMYCQRAGSDHFNVGDYIQGLAANQFMRGDVQLNREALDEYRGEPVKLIMNGWFIHRPDKFPPSDAIRPLFVSFHVSPDVADVFFKPKTIDYLKRYEPIGCRDRETVRKLEEHGIRAFFTGCMTLTLGRTYARAAKADRRGVWFVDPLDAFTDRDVDHGRWWILMHPVRTCRIFRRMNVRMFNGLGFRSKLDKFWRIGAFLRAYSTLFPWHVLEHGEYVSHIVPEKSIAGIAGRFAYADELLRSYAQAHFCVTSRIHCALPCVGKGVPVIFVNPVRLSLSNGRFEGLMGFFNVVDLYRRKMVPRFEFASPDGQISEGTELPVDSAHKTCSENLADLCARFVAEPELA